MRRIVVLGYGMAGHHLTTRVTGHHHAARPAHTQHHAPGGDYTQTGQTAPARINRPIPANTVCMPFHWPGTARANTVTNPALNPTSKVPASLRAAAHPTDAERAGE